LCSVLPSAVSISRAKSFSGRSAATFRTRYRWKLWTPRLLSVVWLPRITSAHFSAQKAANSSRASSRSISLFRLSGSFESRKARASSVVGNMPMTSRWTRRRNTSSDATGAGSNCSSRWAGEDVLVDEISRCRSAEGVFRIGPHVSEARAGELVEVAHEDGGLRRPRETNESSGADGGFRIVAAEDGQVGHVADVGVAEEGVDSELLGGAVAGQLAMLGRDIQPGDRRDSVIPCMPSATQRLRMR